MPITLNNQYQKTGDMMDTADRNKRWIARLERAASVTGFRAQMLKPRHSEHAPRWVYYVGKAA